MQKPNKSSIQLIFRLFSENYKHIPLEVFSKNAYKILISTLLSSRTKDEVTLKAAKRLFGKASNIKSLNKLSKFDIQKLIYPVGFYKVKAKHLKDLAKILYKDFSCHIPKTRKELITLPGIGRKTANLVLNRAFDIPAIAVDTHVHKISNYLGWVKTKTPQQTEKELIKIIPKKYWKDLNRLFVSIGQQYRNKNKLFNFFKENRLL